MEQTNEIMTRDDFRESVFERDGHKCVICGEPAKDAHHIIERRLFSNGHLGWGCPYDERANSFIFYNK